MREPKAIICARTLSRGCQVAELQDEFCLWPASHEFNFSISNGFAQMPGIRIGYHAVAAMKLRPRESAGED